MTRAIQLVYGTHNRHVYSLSGARRGGPRVSYSKGLWVWGKGVGGGGFDKRCLVGSNEVEELGKRCGVPHNLPKSGSPLSKNVPRHGGPCSSVVQAME